jgi:uncharacterized protein YjbI with pentapeptide repeats
MQQPPSEHPELNCLSMQLSGQPISDPTQDTEFLDLYVSLHFHEAWQSIEEGRFKFGAIGGTLKLALDRAEMAVDESEPPSRTVNFDGEAIAVEVTRGGSERQPTWTWILKSGAPVLHGGIDRLKLGRARLTGQPFSIEATFEVSAANLALIEAERLWPHDISPNKHGVLERRLIQELAAFKLQPYLSRVELRYSSLDREPSLTQYEIDASETGFDRLQETIARVMDAKTDDFTELAQLAELDLLQDFAGAKLWGCNLSGVDLSGANLEGTKLRGADLCDADLSEANLRGVQLGGADLSGALLSDANLERADLHRCSLALANLSGANLVGANLTEANLSNANLSDAKLTGANLSGADLHQAGLVLTDLTETNLTGVKVEGARFKKDAGLSVEIEQMLKAGGAIFEEA